MNISSYEYLPERPELDFSWHRGVAVYAANGAPSLLFDGEGLITKLCANIPIYLEIKGELKPGSLGDASLAGNQWRMILTAFRRASGIHQNIVPLHSQCRVLCGVKAALRVLSV